MLKVFASQFWFFLSVFFSPLYRVSASALISSSTQLSRTGPQFLVSFCYFIFLKRIFQLWAGSSLWIALRPCLWKHSFIWTATKNSLSQQVSRAKSIWSPFISFWNFSCLQGSEGHLGLTWINSLKLSNLSGQKRIMRSEHFWLPEYRLGCTLSHLWVSCFTLTRMWLPALVEMWSGSVISCNLH